MTDKEIILILNAIPGLGSVKIQRLLEHFKPADSVLTAGISGLMAVEGISKKTAEEIIGWKKHFDLKKELDLVKKNKISIITLYDEDYPALLKHIYDPPVALYVKGTLTQEDGKAVAVVGARRASYYGIDTSRRIARELAEDGWTVISGMARGIDTSAHQGALSAQGRTIAVLGCGVDTIYPSENKELYDKIAGNGAVISELPFSTPPHKQNFPKRNRIISGMSLGVVVVEAGKFSGSLITARLAAEQGREVFSVPGRIDVITSQGSNVLIKYGAKPVLEVKDILDELRFYAPVKDRKKEDIAKTDALHADRNCGTLNGLNEKISAAIDKEGATVDEIVDSIGVDVKEVWGCLADLELKGFVKRMPGNRYIRC